MTLAIFAPYVGAPSETFIQRHVEGLLPGNTVMIAQESFLGPHSWETRVPTLVYKEPVIEPSLRVRIRERVRPAAEILRESKRIRAFLRRHRVDVAMGEYLDTSMRWLDITSSMGIGFISHAHGHDVSARALSSHDGSHPYLAHRSADAVVTVSHLTRERLVEIGVPADLIHVIPCGVDVPAEPKTRGERDEVVCLAVGRLVPKKGPLLLLESFSEALRKFRGLRLHLVGDGPLLPAVRDFVEAAELEQSVVLHGMVPHTKVKSLLEQADIFVHHAVTDPETGDEEGLPVALLEAMAAALPVVTTFHAGIPEAVSDGINGFLVQEGESQAMSDRIVQCARDARLRSRLGLQGWTRCRDSFSWAHEREELTQLIADSAR